MERWTETFRLRIYEVGPSGQATAVTMMNLFQDAASHHAESFDMGYAQLFPRDLGWVLTKFRLTVDRYPRYGETVTLQTWPRAPRRIFAYRDVAFFVEDELIAVGTSVWCLLDLSARRAISLNRVFKSFPSRDEQLYPDEIPSIPNLDVAWWRWSTVARNSELDLNGHVNNTVYLGWALECLSGERCPVGMPKDLLFSFRKEVARGDSVTSLAGLLGQNITVHRLENGQGDEVARISMRWE
ncbi:MAG: hypothetical protein CSA35_05430 [Dethiosulfovibrio peptidovorans]|nr:MAG: hypothetical protein CSA35_05430 [Dethiosulfovibrio peptidovorans]